MMYYSWRYSATGYNRKVNSPRRNTRKYLGPHRIERGPLFVPNPTPLDFVIGWAAKTTSVVGPAGMSNSQHA